MFKEILKNEDIICQIEQYVKYESMMEGYHAVGNQKQADYCYNEMVKMEHALASITKIDVSRVCELINEFTGGE